MLSGFIVLPVFWCTVSAFFRRAPADVRTFVMGILGACLFVTLVGTIEVVVSHPVVLSATNAYEDVWEECGSSDTTAALYSEYALLYAMRVKPSCINKESVEYCDGYESTTAASVLKAS